MVISDIDPKCGTHLPILEQIFRIVPIKRVFEYGCGLYSTKFFVDHCEYVESVEMQSQEWYEKIRTELPSPKLSLKCMLGAVDAITYFDSLNKDFDLVFVDGHKHSRENAINHAFNRSPTIVVHDTGRRALRRHAASVRVPEGYTFKNICRYKPYTGVFSNNPYLMKELN